MAKRDAVKSKKLTTTRRKEQIDKVGISPANSSRRKKGKESIPKDAPQSDADASYPKTTRPEPLSQREPDPVHSSADIISRKLDAFPDRIDPRDWVYRPSLQPLPNRLINCHNVPLILDQGREGACTGYALAAVINFLLHMRGLSKSVSPKMLYELARRYDEWPGENYEGSSARGAMKGWVRHGVCAQDSWKEGGRLEQFTDAIAKESLQFPGGAFYRVMHRQVRDMHAALAETGILYCTLMVHSGWAEPDGNSSTHIIYDDREGNNHEIKLPVIKRIGHADSGHAIAIVGYTRQGFVIQNSWGTSWGEGGFALLPYEDYLMHATDVWVAQLGVPVETDLWVQENWADTTAGVARVQEAIQLNDIRPYIVDVGNNGELSQSGNYWTTEQDIEDLFRQRIPDQMDKWGGDKRRVLLYLHGGLNDEKSVAQRVLAFRNVMLANQIYPVHIMWETGVMESLRGIIADIFTDVDERAGGINDWLRSFRDGLIEAKDRTFELTVASAGRMLWDEMKENARIASRHPERKGAMQILCDRVGAAMKNLSKEEQQKWELHIVAHSAGTIFAGYALEILCKTPIPIKSIQLMAPAISIAEFESLYMPILSKNLCPHPSLYIMSDVGERDDNIGPYGKSLLYLVSNAFEEKRETPLLGMERFIARNDWDKDKVYRKALSYWNEKVDSLPSLIISGVDPLERNPHVDISPSLSRSNSHGGFDNDPATLNAVLWRMLGEKPGRPFTMRDLQY